MEYPITYEDVHSAAAANRKVSKRGHILVDEQGRHWTPNSAGTNYVLGGSGGSAGVSLAFTQALPFNGDSYVPLKIINGALAFTANLSGAVLGGSVTLNLVADGTNVPTFGTMKEANGSQGWLNTAGILNKVVAFWDGTDVNYSVNRTIGVSPVPVPVLVSAVSPVSAPNTILLTYSVALDPAQVPPASAFTLTNSGGADTVTGVSIGGNVLTLTKSRASLTSDTLTLNYVQPASDATKVKGANGGIYAVALTGQAVTTAVIVQQLRLQNTSNLTESGDGSSGSPWSYVATTTGFNSNFGLGVQSLPANADAEVVLELPGSGAPIAILGVRGAASVSTYAGFAYGIFGSGVGSAYQKVVGGAISAATVSRNQAAGDRIKIKSTAAGVQTLEVSSDSGATWSVIDTGVTNTARKYVNLNPASQSTPFKLSGSGLN